MAEIWRENFFGKSGSCDLRDSLLGISGHITECHRQGTLYVFASWRLDARGKRQQGWLLLTSPLGLWTPPVFPSVPTRASLCVLISSSYKDTSQSGLRSSPMISSNPNHCWEALAPIYSQAEVLGSMWWGHNSAYIIGRGHSSRGTLVHKEAGNQHCDLGTPPCFPWAGWPVTCPRPGTVGERVTPG